MNREIKFKAWASSQKKMFSAEEMTEDQMALLPDGHFANIHSASTKLSTIYTHEEMLPLQFTGLKDKNGVEIYEGDIITTYSKLLDRNVGKEVVEYSRCGFCLPNEEYIEVIGNIYENKNLLKN